MLPKIKELGLAFKQKWGEESKNYVVVVFKGSKREYSYGTRKKLETVDWSKVSRVGLRNTTEDGYTNEFQLIKILEGMALIEDGSDF